MKEFRKNKQGLFICEECGLVFKKIQSLSKHVSLYHENKKKYYNKWIKEETEGLCKTCTKETKFIGFYGYKNCCSIKCTNKYSHQQSKKVMNNKYGCDYPLQSSIVQEHMKQTIQKKYGCDWFVQTQIYKDKFLKNHGYKCSFSDVNTQKKSNKTMKERYGAEYTWQSDILIKKIKKTCIEKYGVEYPSQSEEIKEKTKQTCIEKYGVEYPFQSKEILEKYKQTCQKRYGINNIFQSEEIKEKIKQIYIEKYGVENPQQNKEIFEKSQKTRLEIHQYKNTNIWYQGTFELDFLDKEYDKFPDITRGPSIKYVFNGKNKIYHPDFYIPLLNLIVEIKNSHLAERDKEQIAAKEKATIANGFKYIMIVDKDYSDFYVLLKSYNRF